MRDCKGKHIAGHPKDEGEDCSTPRARSQNPQSSPTAQVPQLPGMEGSKFRLLINVSQLSKKRGLDSQGVHNIILVKDYKGIPLCQTGHIRSPEMLFEAF